MANNENANEESDAEEQCVICHGVAQEEGYGELYRVCGCRGWGTMYHFPCVVNRIKFFSDAACHCGEKYSHPRIRRVQYASVWERIYRSVDQYVLVQAIGFIVFGAYMSRLVYTSMRIPLVLRILFITSVVFALVIYFIAIFGYFRADYRNYSCDYYLIFTHDIDSRNQFAQTMEIFHIEKQDEEQDEEEGDDDDVEGGDSDDDDEELQDAELPE